MSCDNYSSTQYDLANTQLTLAAEEAQFSLLHLTYSVFLPKAKILDDYRKGGKASPYCIINLMAELCK